MKNAGIMKKIITYLIVILITINLCLQIDLMTNPAKVTANAATNMLKSGDFETDFNTYWSVWNTQAGRKYEMYRSYEAPYGYGSYSAAIQAKGAPAEMFSAGLITNENTNYVTVEAGKTYTFVYYAKATAGMNMMVFMERKDNYTPVSEITQQTITANWQRYVVNFTAKENAVALITFVFGQMPENATLFVDGVGLSQTNLGVNSKEVRGYIGDANKKIYTTDLTVYSPYNIEVELPYFNSQNGKAEYRRFNPENIDTSGIYINFYEGTYPGVGKVYVSGNQVGQFNYNVLPRAGEYYPTMVRADEDVTVMGSGFSPVPNTTFLILKATNINGAKYDYWLTPHTIDSTLKQMTFKLPVGISSGSMYVRTSFWNTDSADTINVSNQLAYKVKPKIYKAEWSQKGFDQVGDKITIYGKGLATNPAVNFYNDKNVKILKKGAKVKSIGTEEVIEVETPRNMSKLLVTVEVEGVESEVEEALKYAAKPRLTSVATKYKRQLAENNAVIPAAKVGDAIEVRGEGFAGENVEVEFQGIEGRIRVKPAGVASGGTALTVSVPKGVQSGYLNVVSDYQYSNYLPLEVVPTVSGISPDPVEPGKQMVIKAEGVGSNVNAAKVYFKMSNNTETVVYPQTIVFSNNEANIYLTAPWALSSSYTGVNIQYDKWRDDGKSLLNVRPYITNATFDKDTKTLIIEGYGFSIIPKENDITYKYADENRTVVTPNATILGVYPTEGGQEIRVKINDNYHYGYVSVQVGDNKSNEVSFGPVYIRKIARRVEYVRSENRVMGVLYITGNNFGPTGGVKVGENWARVHYRTDYFIIAVVEKENVFDNPVIVAK